MSLKLTSRLWLLLGALIISSSREATAQTIPPLSSVQESVVKSFNSEETMVLETLDTSQRMTSEKVEPFTETEKPILVIESEKMEKSSELTEQSQTFVQDLETYLKDMPDVRANSLMAQEDSFSSFDDTEPVKPLTPEEIEQKIEQLQQRLETLDEKVPPAIWFGTPGSSSSVPTAWGGRLGDLGVSFSYQQRTRYGNRDDGSIGFLVGLGDPINAVGFDAEMTILDLDPFGERGSFTFKLHRQLPQDFAIAAIVENSLIWGTSDVDTSVAGVVSKMVRLKESSSEPFSRLYLSLGVGSGRFRTEDEVIDDIGSVGVFASAGIRIVEPIHFVTEWNGQDLNVATSITPLRNYPLLITLAGHDLTGNAGDGARFTFSVGYGFNLLDMLK